MGLVTVGVEVAVLYKRPAAVVFTVPAVVRFERVVIFCVVFTLYVPFVPPTCDPAVPLKVRPVPAPIEEVATLPNKAGVALVVVQYAKKPCVSLVEVETVPLLPPVAFMVTGEAPNTVKAVQEAEPVHVTVVVGVLAIVFTPVAYKAPPCERALEVANPIHERAGLENERGNAVVSPERGDVLVMVSPDPITDWPAVTLIPVPLLMVPVATFANVFTPLK